MRKASAGAVHRTRIVVSALRHSQRKSEDLVAPRPTSGRDRSANRLLSLLPPPRRLRGPEIVADLAESRVVKGGGSFRDVLPTMSTTVCREWAARLPFAAWYRELGMWLGGLPWDPPTGLRSRTVIRLPQRGNVPPPSAWADWSASPKVGESRIQVSSAGDPAHLSGCVEAASRSAGARPDANSKCLPRASGWPGRSRRQRSVEG